jgi:polyisoprenoid-binding protein YceI
MGFEKWNEHMKSPEFFNAAAFPTITFHSDKILYQGDKPVAAEGTLNLLGVSKPLNIKILRFTCGTNPINQKALCAADIEATLKRSEFGMTKYLPAVSDEIKVNVPVEAFRN